MVYTTLHRNVYDVLKLNMFAAMRLILYANVAFLANSRTSLSGSDLEHGVLLANLIVMILDKKAIRMSPLNETHCS